MQWVYRSMMAASVIFGALVAAHVVPADWAGVAVAIGTAAGYFSDRRIQPSASPADVSQQGVEK